ncbi:MAG: hypothetical protein Q7J25_12080 [Vicinamibacterales bacterium]|nr:hypothetical protein [Vicinamibacterales bacterium]
MTLRLYDEYEREARAAAAKKYRRWTLPLMFLCAAIGGIVGSYARPGAEGIAAGIVIGALAGVLIQFAIRYFSAAEAAEDKYTADWCGENGCTVLGEYEPLNGPHADGGHRQRGSDAIQGPLNGLPTILYNFSYWTRQSNGKTTTEVEHPFKILQIQGPLLPVASLSFGTRDFLNRFRMFDKLDSAFSKQRAVELESIEFNEKFDLEIADGADDVWIRPVFDPRMIDALAGGTLVFPDLRYYDNCFWLVEAGHYKARVLDEMKAWQGQAAAAIGQLSRVAGG